MACSCSTTGDRKDGCATDHVARQYLGSIGKIDNGIVAVTTLWANAQRYYPLHVIPYTRKTACLAASKARILHQAATGAGAHRADDRGRLRLRRQWRARSGAAAAPLALGAGAPRHSWVRLGRRPTWPIRSRTPRANCRGAPGNGLCAASAAGELTWLHYGPGKPLRAVYVTTDRRALPELTTWYLTTNLPVGQAPLAEVTRLYGLRN